MTLEAPGEEDLKRELRLGYDLRFRKEGAYRDAVWKILTAEFFQQYIPSNAILLDIGCGWGEFINNIVAGKKYGMDLNPDAKTHLATDVELLEQDCSQVWPLPDASLDRVFTSNFFEHLRSKDDLRRTLLQVHRCLRPGGRLICLGPNIRHLAGCYWDFWDHQLPLTERSLAEALEVTGFEIEKSIDRFLPYRMSGKRQAPLPLVRLYVKLPLAWPFFGKQFLVVARRPT